MGDHRVPLRRSHDRARCQCALLIGTTWFQQEKNGLMFQRCPWFTVKLVKPSVLNGIEAVFSMTFLKCTAMHRSSIVGLLNHPYSERCPQPQARTSLLAIRWERDFLRAG